MASFVGPGDTQEPAIWPHLCPSLNQHWQTLDRINPAEKKRRSFPSVSICFFRFRSAKKPLLGHINTIRNDGDRNSKPKAVQASGLRLARRDMAKRLFQVALLV